MKIRFTALFLVLLAAFFLKTPVQAQLPSEPKPTDSVLASVVNAIPERIVIPNLSVDLEVKKARIINGYWEVFDTTAAWGDESAYPGQRGNQVIFAHAREGLFLPLKDAKVGMKVAVFAGGKTYEYSVVDIKKVFPSQIEVVAPTEDETLTLYTCSDFADSKRLVVTAKRLP